MGTGVDKTIARDIETASRILREAGATEVFVFGSAAHGKLRPDSDMDVAVRGIPADRFFRAMTEVTFAIGRQAHLVDLDEDTQFAEMLERKGELKRVA